MLKLPITLSSLLLVLLTLWYFHGMDRYRVTSDNLAPPLVEWDGGSNNKSELVLTNNEKEKSPTIRTEILVPRGKSFRVNGVYSTDNVVQGDQERHKARIYVASRELTKKRFSFFQTLTSETGTVNTKSFSEVYTPPTSAELISIRVQLNHSTGSIEVKDLALFSVEETSISKRMLLVLQVMWSILILLLIWSSYKASPPIPVVAMMLVLSFAILMPQTIKLRIQSTISTNYSEISAIMLRESAVRPSSPEHSTDPPGLEPQTAHSSTSSMFAVEKRNELHSTPNAKPQTAPKRLDSAMKALSFWLTRERQIHAIGFFFCSLILLIWFAPMSTYPGLLLYAVATETAQHFSPGRTPDLKDVYANFAGLLISLLCLILWRVGAQIWRKVKDRYSIPGSSFS